MTTLTLLDLKELILEQSDLCISLFMPGNSSITENVKNQVRFGHLISKANNKLKESRLNQSNIEKRLQQLHKFRDDDSKWHDGFAGIAVFAINDRFRYYKLPFSVDENVRVSHYYYLLPLIPFLSKLVKYHILVIDEGEIRLFLADTTSIKEMPLEVDVETESDYFKKTFDVEEIQSFRSEMNDGRSKNHENIIYHGHGNTKDDRKIRAKRFFQIISRSIEGKLSQNHQPIILAGHDYLVSIFKNVSLLNNLVDESIRLNPGPIKIDLLHKKAGEVSEKFFQKEVSLRKKRYCDLVGTEKILYTPEKIVLASQEGKIDTLFIDENNEVFGTIDTRNGVTEVVETGNIKDESITNFAVILGLQTDARILVLPSEKMPQKVPICGILRY